MCPGPSSFPLASAAVPSRLPPALASHRSTPCASLPGQVFEGHTFYIMSLAINPKDTNTFASACLDHTVKVWSLGNATANFTLEAHEKGTNFVDYYHGGDKPYMITTGDDR